MMMLILVSPNCSTLLHFNLHFDLAPLCTNCDADQDRDAPVKAQVQEPLQLENVAAAACVATGKRLFHKGTEALDLEVASGQQH